MAINRGPWNALVDDTGTGTTGTPWNKQAIKEVLLDPIDAALVVPSAPWTAVAFDALNFWPGVAAGHVTVNLYNQTGKVILWIVKIVGAPAPSASPYLPVAPPGGAAAYVAGTPQSAIAYASDGGGLTPAFLTPYTASQFGIYKASGANWTGTVTTYFTGICALA